MLKEETKRQEKTDAEIVFEEDPDEEEDVGEDEEVDVDDFDLELFHFFDCIGCKAIFQEKTDLLHRAANCDSLEGGGHICLLVNFILSQQVNFNSSHIKLSKYQVFQNIFLKEANPPPKDGN